MFDHPPRANDRPSDDDGSPDPVALDGLSVHWQPLVGRDRRPKGVRLALHNRGKDARPPLSALLDSIVRAFATDDATPFPHGLVLLAPLGAAIDPAMARWSAPRNVLLEISAQDVLDETQARILYESRRQGVRQALRVDGPIPTPERLKFFQYLVGPVASCAWSGIPVLANDVDSLPKVEPALKAGAHALVGWPMCDPLEGKPREFSPSQRAIFQLIRLAQMDAEIRSIEQVFEAEPLLAYMLLTLANSVAFRRGAPTASLRHAITSIGYQRLVKWLVLLLAVSTKEARMANLIFTTLVRGYCMEGLSLACGRPKSEADEAFIVGAFSLLDLITGQPMSALLEEVGLPEAVTAGLQAHDGPYAPYLDMALGMEGGEVTTYDESCARLGLDADRANRALLRAISGADAMLALV